MNRIDHGALAEMPNGTLIPCTLHRIAGETARLTWSTSDAASRFMLWLTPNGAVKRICRMLRKGASWIDVEISKIDPSVPDDTTTTTYI